MKGTTFTVSPAFASHAVVDGNLITGQQQNSGVEAAKLVIVQLSE
jgi:putative intracellular protease/amidase